jgi:starvation-inducible DNA-binding protein
MSFTTKKRAAGARRTASAILGWALAEESRLIALTRRFHHSVSGPHFHSLHRLFADQYRQLEHWLGELDARRCMLQAAAGAVAGDAARHIAAATTHGTVAPQKMVAELLAWHERLGCRLADDVHACAERLGDVATANVLSGLAEFHDTTAWMLRMILHGPRLTPA